MQRPERMLLTVLCTLLFYTTQDHQPRGSTAHSELRPPIVIINKHNTPQTHLQVNLMETFSQLRFLLPSYVLVFIELTKTNQHCLIGIVPSIHPPYTHAALLTYKSGSKWAFILTGQNLSSGLIPHLSTEQPPC